MSEIRRTSFYGLAKKLATRSTRSTGSNVDDETSKRAKYENTYQLEPFLRFKSEKARPTLLMSLRNSLADKEYDAFQCARLTKKIADEIKLRIKRVGYRRYRLIVLVTIGEKNGQAVRAGSGFLWNEKHDNFVSATFENSSLFAIAVLYGVYYE